MKRWLVYAMLAAGAVVTTYPFVWMGTTALKTFSEASTRSLRLFPSVWQWTNFSDTWSGANFGHYFLNSFWVAGWVTAAVVCTSLMAGYAFGRLTFRGRGILFAALLATMMVPFEVILIPNYVLITKMGWYNTYRALIIPWCAGAFAVFLIRQAMLGLPRDYFEAARMDGCGHFRFLIWVAAPLVRPALVTVGLFAFLGSYNGLVWPLIVTSDERLRVVQYGLVVFAGAEGSQRFELLMCAAAIVMAPTVLIYLMAQRYFHESALGAGLKG